MFLNQFHSFNVPVTVYRDQALPNPPPAASLTFSRVSVPAVPAAPLTGRPGW